MPTPPAPRYTSQSDFEEYLRTSGSSVRKQTVLSIMLASAEVMVERYTRRRFAPSPPLDAKYTRQVLGAVSASSGAAGLPQLSGVLALAFNGHAVQPLTLPITAVQLQAVLSATTGIGVGNVLCSGGPLPSYPISVVWQGSLTGEQPLLAVDSSGLFGGTCVVADAGYDSKPPVARRFTTRGQTVIRVPDLRVVDASPDPRLSGSGGVVLYGRRLMPFEYTMGAEGYGLGSESDALGSGEDYAEPVTHLTLGPGYARGGYSYTDVFSFVLPVGGFVGQDLTITGRWGWNPAPPDIVEAVYAVASRRWAERDARFSDSVITPEGMTLAFYKQLPASVQATLANYRPPHIDLIGA